MFVKVLFDLLKCVVAPSNGLDSVIFDSVVTSEESSDEMVRSSSVRAHDCSQPIIFHEISGVRTAIVAPEEVVPQKILGLRLILEFSRLLPGGGKDTQGLQVVWLHIFGSDWSVLTAYVAIKALVLNWYNLASYRDTAMND